MRQFLITITGIIFSFNSLAQSQSEIAKYKNVIDAIVVNYNDRSFGKIRDYFSAEFKSSFSSKKVATVFNSLYEQYGRIITAGNPEFTDSSHITLPLVFEKHSSRLDMWLPFNREFELTGLQFLPPGTIHYPPLTDTTTISEIVQPYLKRKENAGLSIAVYIDGKTLFYNYGEVEKGTGHMPDSNTIYEIGSVTKVFTALLLADLEKKKIVRYTDPLSNFLPDSIRKLKSGKREINLMDLATHRSGLPRMPDNIEATMHDSLNPYADYTIKDLYSYLSNCEPARVPGKEYEYSNLGMGLLGHILAKQLSTTYEDAIKKELLSRMTMNNTTITLSDEQKKIFAKGYDEDGSLTPHWDIQTLEGAGAFRSNARDMIEFIRLNLGHADKELMSILDEAQVKRTKETALGWHFMTIDKQLIYWHNGGTYGFSSFIGFNRNKNTGVVVLSNSGNGVDEMGKLIIKLLLETGLKNTAYDVGN
jgi:CubicO group peptidase (beta-lactamase class C family)